MTNDNQSLTLLLVDDDEVDRIAIKRALKKTDLQVKIVEAENGSAALEILRTKIEPMGFSGEMRQINQGFQQKSRFGAILLDYRLPDLDGLQLISEIQALNIKIPLIVLTGQGDEEIAVEIMKAGAADYLAKNKIEPGNLAKAIANAIRIHEAERAVELANQRLRATNELLLIKNQELERQQQQIRIQNLQLQEAYNLKSQFLANMSHELRTPMNAIMGFSQLLQRQYPDPLTNTQQELVQRIFNNSQNLLNMINEMLDFSKIEAGKLELNFAEFNLIQLIAITVEELHSLAIEKNINLTTDINLKNPIFVQDSNFLKRILINLLSNAIKFTDRGRVLVKAWEIEPDKIAIAIQDTGIGIAAENLKTIFQAFRQVDQSFTRKYSGTGLGLAITDSLVKMIDGTITVESQLEKGSIFQVEIPRKTHV